MKRLLAGLLLLSCNVFAQQTIELEVGQSERLQVATNTQIMVADESVITVNLITPTQLLIKGLAAGYSDLWLINDAPKRLRVAVTEPLNKKLALELQALSSRDTHLALEFVDSFVIASGTVTENTAEALQSLQDNYPQLLNKTEPPISDQPMLRLTVKILEIKRQRLQELGIDWQSATSGPSASTAIKGMFRWSAELDSTLNLLQQQGQAELLASPTLSAQSGESAAFLAGGELPIPQVVAQGMQDVTFREYGIKLNIEPEITATGKIKTQLSAEVSNIDPAVTVAGVPGILSRRTDSIFLSDEGDTLVLSGLMSLEKSDSSNGLPGISELPLLGQLFSSSQQREQQTELLIMVTTERLDAADKRAEEAQQRAFQQQHWLVEAGCSGLQEGTHDGY
ncbi:type II and III secretion system protein family protein [Idiomarina seosinensis]|uniref:Pilus assembly protein CpaC n=1 Tax=Idiomarina seosinensis TaxID=281739 RepID=A0A432ZHA2_9GAMM|nr:pilus assembly protein N-terminal domain-containing protein [Idiomarina seosinensis]RUO77264.1 pilus assembly protein CpaC [Idiomarina seosinensis]